MNKLADAYMYCTSKSTSQIETKEDTSDIYHYKGISRKDCLYSKDSFDSEAFSREIYIATGYGKKSKKHKCRLNLGSLDDKANSIVIYHPIDVEDVFKNHPHCLSTKESVNVFDHHFKKSPIPVIMAISSDGPYYPEVRIQFSSTILGNKALGHLFPTLQKIASYLDDKYKDKDRMNLREYSSQLSMRTILQGIIKAPEIEDKTVLKLSHIIDEGVDKAVTLGSVSRISLEAYVPWKMQSDAEPFLDEAKKIVKTEVLEKNKESLSKNKDSWLHRTIEMEQKAITEQPKQKSVFNKCLKSTKNPTILSDNSVTETAFVITAGSDTTSHNIENALKEIIKNEKIYQELSDEIFSLKKSPDQMTLDDFKKLKLTKQAVLEVLRLEPPLPIQKVLVEKDFTMHDGTKIKAGTHIYVNVKECNRTLNNALLEDKEYDFTSFYKDFDKFDPHRFDQFDDDTLNKFTDATPKDFKLQYGFQTFGRGKRMCPGRNLAVLETMTALVHNFYHFNMTLLNTIIKEKVTFGMRSVSYESKDSNKEIPIEASIKLRK